MDKGNVHPAIEKGQAALKAYKKACTRAYRSGYFLGIHAYWEALREAWRHMPDSVHGQYRDFADFLACNDAVPLNEVLADLRQ